MLFTQNRENEEQSSRIQDGKNEREYVINTSHVLYAEVTQNLLLTTLFWLLNSLKVPSVHFSSFLLKKVSEFKKATLKSLKKSGKQGN